MNVFAPKRVVHFIDLEPRPAAIPAKSRANCSLKETGVLHLEHNQVYFFR